MHRALAHRRRFLLLASGLLATLPRTHAMSEEPRPDKIRASQILEHVAEAYAKCKSYRDSGVVKTVLIGPDRKRTRERKPFTTAFVRPDRFRFEYKDKKSRNIIWRRGDDVQTWWDVKPGIEKPKSLGLALAGATGASSGSAHTVPALLMPDEAAGRRLTDITKPKRVEDAKLDGLDCFRIQGQFGDSPTTIWVDKRAFLVRRIDSQMMLDDSRTEITTTYKPVINGKISEKRLEFDPPKPD